MAASPYVRAVVPSTPSLAERRFIEVCEEIEQLGRDGKSEEAADIGMEYLQDLWDQYSPRIRAYYSSNTNMSTLMTDQMHGQQLRRDISRGQGEGFIGPEPVLNGTYKVLHFLAHIGSLAEFRLF